MKYYTYRNKPHFGFDGNSAYLMRRDKDGWSFVTLLGVPFVKGGANFPNGSDDCYIYDEAVREGTWTEVKLAEPIEEK